MSAILSARKLSPAAGVLMICAAIRLRRYKDEG